MQGNIFTWTVNSQIVPGANSSDFIFKPTKAGYDTIKVNQSILFTIPQSTDSKSCEGPSYSFLQLIKNVPKVRIYGDSTICQSTPKEFYSIRPNDSSDVFNWTVTGNNVLWAGTKSPLYRQIDWIETGFDTIRVSEDNGVCSGYGYLAVKVAPH